MAHRLARLFAPASSCLAKGGAAAAASAATPGATTTTAAGLSGLLASEGAATAGARRFFQSSRAAAAEARPSAPEVHGSGNVSGCVGNATRVCGLRAAVLHARSRLGAALVWHCMLPLLATTTSA